MTGSSNGRKSDSLHPLIHRVILGLTLWLLISIWLFFDGPGYIKLALAMISALVVASVAIPFTLSRADSRNDGPPRSASGGGPESFASWVRGNFDTRTGQCKSATAAFEVLLPIAAVALGMTAFGIVFTIAHAHPGL
jgi:hypothetical protein